MNKRSILKFTQAEIPITEPVSKFGGQPNWIGEPQWPLDKEKGEKMYFVGQIKLVDELFGETKGEMAYIFFDASEDGDLTWDPESGQNAVIVQPGNNALNIVADITGPSAEFNEDFENYNESGLCEFTLDLELSSEREYLNEEQLDILMDENESEYDKYWEAMSPSKIGGNPVFIQSEEIPIAGEWKLLCQLDESEIPVYVNFGVGVAYAFINTKGTNGKILWQC